MKPSALLRTAAGLMFRGDMDGPVKHVYICLAIDAAASKVVKEFPELDHPKVLQSWRILRSLILDRLHPYSSVGSYLREHVGVDQRELLTLCEVEITPGMATTLQYPTTKLQEFRLAWMESLAQELEAEGR